MVRTFQNQVKKMSCQCLIGIGEYGYVYAVICCRLIYYRLPKLLDYVTQRNTCIMTEPCLKLVCLQEP